MGVKQMNHILTNYETNEKYKPPNLGFILDNPFNIRLVAGYGSLSAKLQQAADYVVANPVDIASRSLRSVAKESGVAPATFSRMARALDFEHFDALRDVIRMSIGSRIESFSAKAARLKAEHGDGARDFTAAHMGACLDNISTLGAQISHAQMIKTVQQLKAARKVLVLGALGSTGVAEYMAYTASFITDTWALAGRGGASLGSALVEMGDLDALIVITKPPFVPRVLNAARMAQEQGVYTVVISDSHACEALRYADSPFIVPSFSPHFFTSYTATIFLVEAIVGELAAQSGVDLGARIKLIETRNRRLQEACNMSQ